MCQLGTIPDPGQEEARASDQEREVKGLMDKAKGRINEAGGTKDNIRDELGEADAREDRKEATPREWDSLAPGSQGLCPGRVGRVARASPARIANLRGTWAGAMGFACELRPYGVFRTPPPWGCSAHTALYLADRPTTGYRGC
jgi:hypothetical protein